MLAPDPNSDPGHNSAPALDLAIAPDPHKILTLALTHNLTLTLTPNSCPYHALDPASDTNPTLASASAPASISSHVPALASTLVSAITLL